MTSGYATPTSYDQNTSNFEDVKGLTRERPWLLSTNRKLRHLQGISVRNLSLSKPQSRPHGKTIDDESLPTALKTRAKLLAQREHHRLEHSKSSNDLVLSLRQNGKLKTAENAIADGSIQSRPSPNALRRRSTLNWSNTNTMTRQKKLVDAIGGRIADTWFSIHCPDIEEAVYVSEVVEKTMNPSYRFFDLNSYGPKVTRRDDLTLKLWVNTERGQDHIQLIDLQVHLGSLQFIGKSLESFHHPLPQNCIIFHLSDGIYTSFTDLPLDNYAPPSAGLPPKSPSITPQSTSSFDALMRLSNLDDCIQDALATREQITSQISSFLEDHQSSRTKIASVSTSQESLASTRRAVSATRRMLSTVQRRRADLDASIKARRAAIESGHISQKQSQSYLSSAEETLSSKTTLSKSTIDTLNGQIRRICEDLSAIYPIEPVEGKPLSFTIRGLYLPNANFFSTTNNASETTTAAALGMVAHILDLLSYYLSTPLPYPVTANGSTSSVYDPISVSLTHTSSTNASAPSSNSASNVAARTFPLFQTTSIQYRFEYGVFLLNTNLELLMWKRGLRMVDQRQTLANLKYLLVVCGSGRGEVPGRKRGVVGALSSAGGDEASRSEREDEEEEGSGNGGKKVWKGKGKEVVGNGGLR